MDYRENRGDAGKVVPPNVYIAGEAAAILEKKIWKRVVDQIMRDANVEERVKAELARLELPSISQERVAEWLDLNQDEHWRSFVHEQIDHIVKPELAS
jgi:hypothetical protein